MIVETLDKNGPLCPNESRVARHPAHAVADLFADRLNVSLERHIGKDGEGQLVPAAEDIYDDVVYADHGMRLFLAEAQPVQDVRTTVQAYYWQCPICGFVLPAQAVKLF